ncbi:MAG: phosphatidylserine decarboxylase, partial [Thiovulaceae bacterium]|nr:phosphatidylserine decarboxylase [Sulfurimonadaceae bacterium]
LFIENERVVLECEANGKIFFLVLVGALNVGQMVVNFEPDIETNANKMERKVYAYDNVSLKKGEELGYFKMGSTVILLAPKEMLDVNVSTGDKVSFADTIATLKA